MQLTILCILASFCFAFNRCSTVLKRKICA